ncbi:hypothetical protein NB311A_19295 [Nitrobacter sp. Nb-311A]|nr:hypothetical protein NB311A_19295 [Nitrobacter sp. Nb-311A]
MIPKRENRLSEEKIMLDQKAKVRV